MRTFSDYKDEEALDLWMDLLDPITEIMNDENLQKMRKQKGVNVAMVAKDLVKRHKKEVSEILLRIDPAPLTGLNILTRLIALIHELTTSPDAKGFFDFAEEMKKDEGSSGSATATIEAPVT